ncbi:MAG: HAD hydrolase family protein [Thermoanaerobaculia bacterium]
MRFRVLALDYDGTITTDGTIDPRVRESIAKARARGMTVLIATGRRIPHLRSDCGDLTFVDGIVAENGAVIVIPSTGEATRLAEAPPEAFARELERRAIPCIRGEVIVELDADNAADVLRVIRNLQLPLVLAFNRGRVMVLPQGVSKATGLLRLLAIMRKSVHNTVAIGDAENDHELLRAAELGSAVQWGSAALIAAADDVVRGTGPAAVAAYVDHLLESDHIPPSLLGRRKLVLGTRSEAADELVRIDIKGRNMLIVGDPRSGKSWVTGLLAEQLVMQRYCVCVVDPEGDYEGLESLPDVIVFGGDEPPPRAREITRALRHSDVSMIVNLSKLALDEKRLYVRELLEMLAVLQRRTGLPHRIVLDEAHYFLDEPFENLIDLDLGGYTLVSYRVSQLPQRIVDEVETLIVTRHTDRNEVARLVDSRQLPGSVDEWTARLSGLRVDEVMLLPGVEKETKPARVRLAKRRTYHVRHLQKYIDVPVAPHHAFVFTRLGEKTGLKALTLEQLSQVLASVETDAIDGHLRRGDFSRWVADVYGDRVLAGQIADCEERYRLESAIDVNDAINAAIRARYADSA